MTQIIVVGARAGKTALAKAIQQLSLEKDIELIMADEAEDKGIVDYAMEMNEEMKLDRLNKVLPKLFSPPPKSPETRRERRRNKRKKK